MIFSNVLIVLVSIRYIFCILFFVVCYYPTQIATFLYLLCLDIPHVQQTHCVVSFVDDHEFLLLMITTIRHIFGIWKQSHELLQSFILINFIHAFTVNNICPVVGNYNKMNVFTRSLSNFKSVTEATFKIIRCIKMMQEWLSLVMMHIVHVQILRTIAFAAVAVRLRFIV